MATPAAGPASVASNSEGGARLSLVSESWPDHPGAVERWLYTSKYELASVEVALDGIAPGVS